MYTSVTPPGDGTKFRAAGDLAARELRGDAVHGVVLGGDIGIDIDRGLSIGGALVSSH